ncbi:LLM class F420-dependent oxidoreductase [Speluncibacter jeojiensis]
MTKITMKSVGVWRPYPLVTVEEARALDRLGVGTLWLGGSPPADLAVVDGLLAATTHLQVATGIVNIWTARADEVARSFHRIEAAYPGRFLLGIGAGHPEALAEYRSPYRALEEYLDRMDEAGVPAGRRVLAALGPRVLRLSARRSAGAHPYLTTPEHTGLAREILGAEPLLAPEQKVVLDTDAQRARDIGRAAVANPYLQLRNYVENLKRLGFAEEDLADGGTDAVVDALVAHGDAAAVVGRIEAHLAAGADQVAVQLLPADADPVPTMTALAAAVENA